MSDDIKVYVDWRCPNCQKSNVAYLPLLGPHPTFRPAIARCGSESSPGCGEMVVLLPKAEISVDVLNVSPQPTKGNSYGK